MAKKLNQRETSFVYWRARGESLVNSVLKAGYKAKSKLIASSYGCQLEKKLNIAEAIDKEKLNIFDKNCITVDYVLGNLKQLAENSKNEADKIRATELIGKYLAMFTDKQEISQAEKEDNQFSLDRLAKLKVSTN